MTESAPSRRPAPLERVALAFTAWAERWIPDAFIFALIGTMVVVVAAIATRSAPPLDIVQIWGKGFWGLIPFTMQMALVVILGYVLATSPPVHRLIRALASVPKTSRAAVACVALLALLTSWLNWGFSLMFSAMLAKAIARRMRDVDYRALAAASFLGLGSIWAQGLSGSAALQMATPSMLPERIRAIVAGGGKIEGGIIHLADTIFRQSLLCVLIEILVVTIVVYLAAPRGAHVRNAEAMGIDLGVDAATPIARSGKPGEWLEHSPLLSLLFAALAMIYLARYFAGAPSVLNAVNLDTINLVFLALGVLLHWTPARLMRAVRDATPAVWGIVLQFPLYAGMAAIIAETHLNERIAHAFVRISTPLTFPPLVAAYSALLGMFVPSGGSKWVIEAPYVMQAAHDHHVHLGWMVAVYDLGEALANLVQPFWMLPILGLFSLRARDVMGFTFLVFVVLAPIVLVLVTLLGATLRYPL
ncbi:MAG: TIGR00366 family protein [Planctomycetota bacterium]